MKHIAAFLLLVTSLYAARAQEFRLNYDSTTIPELYQNTHIFLEQNVNGTYERYRGKYKIHTDQADLKGLQLTYDARDLQKRGGKVLFTVTVNGAEQSMSLSLPVLTDIRFNLYTDSIKPILNYYVNVEGIYSSGRIFPLTEEQVTITSDTGTMQGMAWKAPAARDFDHVTFIATSKANPSIKKPITLYLKKQADPRDAEGYEEPENEPRRRR